MNHEEITKHNQQITKQNQETIKQLREPFTGKEIEWKIQVTSQDKVRGMAVAYMDARAVQKRLDEVAGPFNWKNVYSLWHDKSQICGISIFNAERNEWVTKFDGAENSDIEPIKGGLSDSFKRAASVWGIGRYLYELDGIWVEIEPKGKSFAIKQNQYAKLETAYNVAVNTIFGAGASQPATHASQPVSSASTSSKRQGASAGSSSNASTGSQGKRGASAAQSATQPAPPPPENTAYAQPPVYPDNTQSSAHPSNTNLPANPAYDFKVQSMKPSGKSGQALELLCGDGKIVKAYIKTFDNAISPGSQLQGVQMERKTSEYGDYNLINAYKLAA